MTRAAGLIVCSVVIIAGYVWIYDQVHRLLRQDDAADNDSQD